MNEPTNYTPRSDKAEWHLTYACDLACVNCNRLSSLPPQTPDMTLEDAREFCRQARALDWQPRIMLIGGEPTLHPAFFEFVSLAYEFCGDASRTEVWSNGYGPRAKECLDWVRAVGLATVQEGTRKLASVLHPVCDIFLAPLDFQLTRQPCGTHSMYADPDCGISVDAAGYSLCCMGGAIDGIFQLGVRTKRLADLFDGDFARRQTRALCDHCGQHAGIDAHKIAASRVVHGSLMSKSWQQAVARIEVDRQPPTMAP